jgi:hypothetical protein
MSVCQHCGIPLQPSGGNRPRKWCSERCRKRQYDRACSDCGTRIEGCNPGRTKGRCMPCSGKARQIWTHETIIVAIQAWAREHGGIPPSAMDWNSAMAITRGRPEKAQKFYEDDAWPCATTVQAMFGTWSAAIAAAGLCPRGVGKYGRDGEDDSLCREIADRYAAGKSSDDLADEYGVTAHGIRYRIHKVGGALRPPGRSREVVAA